MLQPISGETSEGEDPFASALDIASTRARAWLSAMPDRAIPASVTVEQVERDLGVVLPADGESAAAVLERLADAVEPGLMASQSARFFGWVMGGTLPAALGADWLVSAWDQNSGSALLTPTTVALERVAGRWMLDILGLPESASVGFVTGGQMANFTCLATARNAVLARAGWDLSEQGLRESPPIRFVVGADRHGSIDRAARFRTDLRRID
jgi:glutamate/tyrosine decarboxylase-like PLP-dependent enzyme